MALMIRTRRSSSAWQESVGSGLSNQENLGSWRLRFCLERALHRYILPVDQTIF